VRVLFGRSQTRVGFRIVRDDNLFFFASAFCTDMFLRQKNELRLVPH
jgi:hypothetical protein